MSMHTITERFLPKNPYTRPGIRLKGVRGLVIHWTANESLGADDEAHYRYFSGNAIAAKSYASAHYFVDHDSTLQIIPDGEMAYHVGAQQYRTKALGAYPNETTIGIETCVNQKGEKFKKALDQTARLAAKLLKQHGLKVGDVYRHYDITGKDCPKYFVSNTAAKQYGLGSSADKAWKDFLKLVESYLNPKAPPALVKPKTAKIGSIKMKRETDVYARPQFGTGIGQTIAKGQTRNIYAVKDGFYQTFDGSWIPSGSGKNFTFTKVPASKPEEPADIMYRVVTGSFGERANAQAQIDRLKKAGFDSFLLAEGKSFRVITGSFGARLNADERLGALKAKGFDSFVAVYRK